MDLNPADKAGAKGNHWVDILKTGGGTHQANRQGMSTGISWLLESVPPTEGQLPGVSAERKSPDGACGRFESGRAAPPVKAGPSGPVVPGPSQAATLLLRVH